MHGRGQGGVRVRGQRARLQPRRELLARFCGAQLRGGGGGGDGATPRAASDGELDAALDAAMALFRHVQAKDAFEAYYKAHLARRLLLARSASHELERGMIAAQG